MTKEQISLIRELIRLEVEAVMSGAFSDYGYRQGKLDEVIQKLTENN